MSVDIEQWIVKIPVLLFAITIHEYAHGKVAWFLGDPTAKKMGRISFNPLIHIDPIGAICLFLFNFGWAKPVPVDPRFFRNTRRDTIIMSLSGPLANIFVAFMAGALIRHFFPPLEVYRLALIYLLFMNLGLGLFNLLPISPLDGSHVLENILPPTAAQKYRAFSRYGPLILIGVILMDNFTHIGIFNYFLLGPMRYLANIFSGVDF